MKSRFTTMNSSGKMILHKSFLRNNSMFAILTLSHHASHLTAALHVCVCLCMREGQIPVCFYSRSLHYSKCIFIVEPISSSTDSCSGTILCYSCWYFNYRGNLSKSLQLLSSTLMRHFSQNQYCRSQPGLNHLSSLLRTQKLSWHHRSGSGGV